MYRAVEIWNSLPDNIVGIKMTREFNIEEPVAQVPPPMLTRLEMETADCLVLNIFRFFVLYT